MTKGWCPVHDRIVESRNGACPECGTPLVDLTARRPASEEARLVVEDDSPEADAAAPAPETKLWPEIRLPERFFGRGRVSIGPAAIAAILAVAVLASFLVGLAIPRGQGEDAPTMPPVRSRHTVGEVREGPGIDLRLESFDQRGARVTIRVVVEDPGDAEIGAIQSIDVTPLAAGSADEGPGAMNLGVRQTVTADSRPGFIAEGELALAESTAITGIRIETLHLTMKDGVDLPVDLSGLTPASGAPRAKAVRSPQRSAGYKDYRVSGAVGWSDRLEVRLSVFGDRDAWLREEDYTLFQPGEPPADGVVLSQSPSEEFVHVAFLAPPPWSKDAELRVAVRGVSITGNWEWEFA